MFQLLPVLIGFVLSAPAARAAEPAPRIDIAVVREVLDVIAGETSFRDAAGVEHRLVNRRDPDQRALARDYLASVYSAAGFRVRQLPAGDRGAVNLFATRHPEGGTPIFLMGAHLDNVGNRGANDDGTGIAVGVAVAIAYARQNPRVPLTMAAWDLEESGLVGSRAAAPMVATWDVRMALNLDMVGRNLVRPTELMFSHCDRPDTRAIYDRMLDVLRETRNPLGGYHICQGRSDHDSLLAVGIPTLHFQGGRAEDEPCYHRACDTVANVDFGYLQSVGDAALNLLLSASAE